jgi:hypothetical protein
MPLAAQVRQQYEAAFVNGCGDLDFFVLAREAARESQGSPEQVQLRTAGLTPREKTQWIVFATRL